MNYATISPDSRLLAAVGDEPRAYFYGIKRNFGQAVLTENDEKFTGWEWELLRCIELDVGTRFDDGCCFTVAFSPSSRLCAIGSQSGAIIIFDATAVQAILEEPNGKDTIIRRFHSSRSFYHGGAVRSMSFSPEPWDILVWIEDHGRAGIADTRQNFSRGQMLELDTNEPGLQEVRTEFMSDDFDGSSMEFDGPLRRTSSQREIDAVEDPAGERGREAPERLSFRESVIQDLTERERLIVEFLNTTRWSSREEGLTDRPGRVGIHPHATHPRLPGSTDGASRASRPTSPLGYDDGLHDFLRENHLERLTHGDREPGQSILATAHDEIGLARQRAGAAQAAELGIEPTQPSITLNWTASPSEMQSSPSNDPSASGPSSNETIQASRPEAPSRSSRVAEVMARRRMQRSSSIPHHPERTDTASETRHNPSRPANSELGARFSNAEVRASVAAERLRRNQQGSTDAHTRVSPWEQRYRQQLLGFEQTRSPRWMRAMAADLPNRASMVETRVQEPGGTAGLGWGADRRTL